MARRRERYVDATPRRDVYFGMLAITAACAILGILLLLLEAGEYSTSQPSQSPTVSLPNMEQLKRTAPAPGPANPGQAEAPMGGT